MARRAVFLRADIGGEILSHLTWDAGRRKGQVREGAQLKAGGIGGGTTSIIRRGRSHCPTEVA
jgi:hypothetical protein